MIGKTLSHYKIIEELGAGGMGRVYRAHDSRLGRDVAVKVLQTHLASTPEALARFEREARTVSQLNHPHICTLHDVGRDGDTDFLVMELVRGRSLAERLTEGPLPVPEVLSLSIQTAEALARAHAAGVVHRDLKPGNLMLTDSGVKLLDFGLAKALGSPEGDAYTIGAAGTAPDAPTLIADDEAIVDTDLTNVGTVLGTLPYMAPEQRSGSGADARTDVYAFGCVLYEMATASRAADGLDAKKLPKALLEIVNRCLQPDPAERFGSADELQRALERVRDWPQREGLPELARIIETIQGLDEGPESWQAWELAREIEWLAPGNEQLERLRAEFTHPLQVTSEPAGALVSIRRYDRPDEWIPLGATPLNAEGAPRAFLCLRIQHPGGRTANDLWWNHAYAAELYPPRCYLLHASGMLPPGMEYIPAGSDEMTMPGLESLGKEPVPAFMLDRDPVTNRQYKEFIDAGGYEDARFWQEPFQDGDRTLSRAEAMARFTDTVGRPGPAGWELGDTPPGKDDHPVTGVSWFEAAAYAAWAGKKLPTVFHWNRAAMPFAASQVVPAANLAGRDTVPVGTTNSVNRFGVRDLAGNVREWARNEVNPDGQRFILGGGWNDPEYAFADAYAQSPWDRSQTNGFRCMREAEDAGAVVANADSPDLSKDPDPLARAIEIPFRDFLSETPVNDQTFAFFERMFLYDREPLNAVIEADAEDPPLGRRQTVQVDAAYGPERLTLYIYPPTRGEPPHPVVVVFPGSGALMLAEVGPGELRRADYLIRAGYAVVLPVYKGTYQRKSAVKADTPKPTALYRDHLVMWAKDLSRTIDYLETREDLDTARVAYLGLSWGGQLGGILPAVEKRIRAVVLYVAGLSFQRPFPEADAINYVPRVTQPTLMLNGELDFYFPKETSQRPMYEMLGTPDEHKRWMTFAGAHSVPRVEMVREVLAWLERYLAKD